MKHIPSAAAALDDEDDGHDGGDHDEDDDCDEPWLRAASSDGRAHLDQLGLGVGTAEDVVGLEAESHSQVADGVGGGDRNL